MDALLDKPKIPRDAYYQARHVKYDRKYCHLVEGRIRSARFTLDLSDIVFGSVTVTRTGKNPMSYRCTDYALSREECIANAMNMFLQEKKDTDALAKADRLGYVIDTLQNGRVEACFVNNFGRRVYAYGDTVVEAVNKLSAIVE